MSHDSTNAVAVIGAGGMGLAVARRLGPGLRVILADYSKAVVDNAAKSLQDDGYDVETLVVDIADKNSVEAFAQRAAAIGHLTTVVNTAGIAAAQGSAKRVYEVNLLGTAHIIDAFLEVMPPGSSLVSISSMAAYLMPSAVREELEQHLATAPTSELLDNTDIDLHGSARVAYAVSKRGNIVRIQAAAKRGREKRIRFNSISPGFISTPMLREELETEVGASIRSMISSAPISRAGTTGDIANAVAFLASPDATFVTGVDLLVDGGIVAALRTGKHSDDK